MGKSKDKKSDKLKAAGKKAIVEPVAKVAKLSGKEQKKSKKPQPESDSETSESSESESDASKSSASDSGSDSGSESGSDSGSESDSGSSSSGSEKKAKQTKATVSKHAKVNGTNGLTNGAKKGKDESSDESDDSSESDDSDKKDAAPSKKPAVNGSKKKDDSSDEDSEDDSSGSSSGSDDDSDDNEEEAERETAVAAPKKRKAEIETEPVAKKAKTEGSEGASCNLFVGNLSWNVDEEWLGREFAEFGEVVGCRIMTDRATGRSKGFGYVDFADSDAAATALKAKKDVDLDGRPMNVDFSTPRKQNDGGNFVKDRADKFGDSVKSNPSDTLFIGNISFSATAESFQEAFGEYGTVTRVSLPTDQETGSLKGFGYVSFTDISEAQAAIEALNGVEIDGRRIRLDFATPRAGGGGDRGGRGGGRGRGDRGGRGFGGRGGGGRGGFGGRGGGGFGDRGRGRGGPRTNTTERGGFGDFSGKKMTF